jgi:hypothetical protein
MKATGLIAQQIFSSDSATTSVRLARPARRHHLHLRRVVGQLAAAAATERTSR